MPRTNMKEKKKYDALGSIEHKYKKQLQKESEIDRRTFSDEKIEWVIDIRQSEVCSEL